MLDIQTQDYKQNYLTTISDRRGGRGGETSYYSAQCKEILRDMYRTAIGVGLVTGSDRRGRRVYKPDEQSI